MNEHDNAPVMNGRTSIEELQEYSLPTSALTMKLGEKDRGRIPLVLVACGSFSPCTYRA